MISMSTSPLGPIRPDRAANAPSAGPGDDSFGKILERHVADEPAPASERGERGESSPGSAAAATDRDGRPITTDSRPTPDVDRSDKPSCAAATDEVTIDEPSDADDPDASDEIATDGEQADAGRLAGAPAHRVPIVPAPTGPAIAAPATVTDMADAADANSASVPPTVLAAATVPALVTTESEVRLPTAGADIPSDVLGSSATQSADTADAPVPTIKGIAVEVIPASAASTPVTPVTTSAPAATGTAPPSPSTMPSALSAFTQQAPTALGAVADAVPGPTADAPNPAPSSPRAASQATSMPIMDPAVAVGAPGTAIDADTAPTVRPTVDAAAAPVGDDANGFHSIAGATTPPTSNAAATASGQAVDGPAAPLRTIDLAEQAQRDTQIRRAEQLTRLDIDVTTEGLGAIRIEAANAGGGLQLNLGAERASTRHLLVEQAAVLRDELGGATVSVDIGRGHRDAPPDHSRGQRAQPHMASASAAATDGSISPRRSAVSRLLDTDRGLDLHL